jgi:hypothetical protein
MTTNLGRNRESFQSQIPQIKTRRSIFPAKWSRKQTMNASFITPIMCKKTVPGETMNLNLNSKVFFNPYRDCGLFGMVVVGNDKEIVGKEVMKKVFPFNYAVGVSDYELNKAKNKLYMDLLNIHTANDLMYLIGPQMVYFGRRVSSKEIAENVNKVTKEDIYRVMKKWFVNGRPSLVGCGNKRKINEIINHYIQYKHSVNVKL